MLNSNDIFDQIGFIKKTQQHNYSFQNKQLLIACLQIQLGPDENYFLDISPSDDPHGLAVQFCSQHNLNSLAINIIEEKIKEAKERQFNKEKKSAKNISNSRYKEVGKLKKQKNISSKNKRQFLNKSINEAQRQNRSSQSKSKPKLNKKPTNITKSPKRQKLSKSPQKQKSPIKKTTSDFNNLYMKGLVKAKMKEEQRNRIKQQRQKQQLSKLTFKPQINLVSEKIVEFRKTTGTGPKKKPSSINKFEEQLKACTFKPQINKVSNIIANRRRQQNQQYNHFEMLYRNPYKKQKTIDIEQQQSSFKPKLNTKTNERITEPFLKRMEIAMQKRQKAKQEIQNQSEYSFQPTICRAPKMARNKQNEPIWQQLYKKNNTKEKNALKDDQSMSKLSNFSKITNQHHFENLISNRIVQVFNQLDGDKDGVISPQNIDIETVGKQIVIFLTPIFSQMEEINAKLGLGQFNTAVRLLLNQTGIVGRSVFLKKKTKIQSSSTFVPQINKKSRQMIQMRKVTNIYENLYEQGKRQAQQKQLKIEMARAMNEQKQLQQCSFKPNLSKSSKLYIDRILSKKYLKDNDSESFFWQQSRDIQ